ncbi:Hypothetical predicted protein [Pelobates cultripes]|uniref:Uncharacterized protein n=1 Tax=Pelobates cultripes TaxID=61616 RepID=A0AAD1R172_PELCU|nr:Hypothetical predicted protein [Pelobates cultripes]
METGYAQPKRTTLKKLLEARGGIASSKAKRTLISELMELDRENLAVASPAVHAEETEQMREIRELLSLFSPNPTPEIILRIILNADTKAKAQRALQVHLLKIQ